AAQRLDQAADLGAVAAEEFVYVVRHRMRGDKREPPGGPPQARRPPTRGSPTRRPPTRGSQSRGSQSRRPQARRISFSPNSRSATRPRRRQVSISRLEATIGLDASVYFLLMT